MREFLEQLAALLEKHEVQISSYTDSCDEPSIQFFRPNVGNPWTDSIDIDGYVTHETIREYLKQEQTK